MSKKLVEQLEFKNQTEKDEIINSAAYHLGYTDQVLAPVVNDGEGLHLSGGGLEDNPQTKEQFLNEKLIGDLKTYAKAYKKKQATVDEEIDNIKIK